jgi:Ca2+:H+ antiporter
VDEKKAMDMTASSVMNSAHPDHPGSMLTRQATSTSVARSDIRSSQLYKRIVGQSFQQVGLGPNGEAPRPSSKADSETPHVVPPKDSDETQSTSGFHLEGLSDEANQSLFRHITEIAATTSAIATRDATKAPHKAAQLAVTPVKKPHDRPHHTRTPTFTAEAAEEVPPGHTSGGHDAPNWSRTKSAVILLTATIAYAIIAEILVSTVDAVLEGSDIDEKFLGITLFALVPNTTEFLVGSPVT